MRIAHFHVDHAALAAAAYLGLAAPGCGSDSDIENGRDAAAGSAGSSGSIGSGGSSGTSPSDGGSGDAGAGGDASGDAPLPCSTRVTYGSSWIEPANHPDDHDDATGVVTWDGSCTVDGAGNAIATLSNGWQPVFQGRSCIIALDYSGACEGVPSSCETRIHYGPSWLPAPNHPDPFDDVGGVVTWNGTCAASGGNSHARLSNGWQPHFAGVGACDLSFRHTQCNGLYANPVVAEDCPDPGVTRIGDSYVMTCTPGPAYRIFESKDLVSWTSAGTIFDGQSAPSWASSHFWAPEIHAVGSQFVAYFSAKRADNGVFAIGAATAPSPTGPFTDIGAPLVTEPHPGAIDAHYFRASSGQHYILWKIDGNAIGASTPIKIQELSPDGTSTVGQATTILTNTLGWEGALVEGPWMIEESGTFHLFYSGNGYASPSYGVGVARSSLPLGPFTKKGAPILATEGDWAGPGHGAILRGPSGDWVHVYHAWRAGNVGQAPGRIVLVDRVQWVDGWPEMRGAPSSRSQPKP